MRERSWWQTFCSGESVAGGQWPVVSGWSFAFAFPFWKIHRRRVTCVTYFILACSDCSFMLRPVVHIQSYRDLVVWQKAMRLVAEIYRFTQGFPQAELYGLVSQLRRAAVSVPSNIAEGQARLSTGEFKQFLGHARGSLMEVETQILVAEELGYLKSDQIDALLNRAGEVGRLLNGLLRSLPNRRT